MAIDDSDLFPVEPIISGAHTLIRNGLMQSNLDAGHFKILNLDTSNLVFDPIPTQAADPNNWFNSYDNGTHTFGFARPSFTNLSGNLTLTQQSAITRVGTITQGLWHGSDIEANYLPTLDLIDPPIRNLSVASKRIVDLADPIADDDAVTLRIVNSINGGTQPKAAVRVASTENLTIIGLGPIDGVTLDDGDRVLVKDQTGSHNFQNGIWDAHVGSWTRSVDADTAVKLEHCTCFVLEGDTNALNVFLETTELPFYIDITHTLGPFAEFEVFSHGSIVQAGAGLDMIGNEIFAVGTAGRITVSTGIDISSSYVGQTSLSVLGTIITGRWEASIVDPVFGGTGVNNFGSTITLAGNLSTSLSVGAPLGSPLAFVLAGSTSLSLPIVGRLATLAGDESFSNKHISADQIDSGVLLITVGGTSANNAIDALNNLLPDQAGHADHVLTTDGAGKVSWVPVSSLP